MIKGNVYSNFKITATKKMFNLQRKIIFIILLFSISLSGTTKSLWALTSLDINIGLSQSGTTEPSALYFTDYNKNPFLKPAKYAYLNMPSIEVQWYFWELPWFDVATGFRASIFESQTVLFSSKSNTLSFLLSTYSVRTAVRRRVYKYFEPNLFVDFIANRSEMKFDSPKIQKEDFEYFNEAAYSFGGRAGVGINFVYPLLSFFSATSQVKSDFVLGWEMSFWINSDLKFERYSDFELKGYEQYFRFGYRFKSNSILFSKKKRKNTFIIEKDAKAKEETNDTGKEKKDNDKKKIKLKKP